MQCAETKKDGSPCKAAAVNGEHLCAGHLGLGVAADPVGAANRSAVTRQAQAQARKRRPQDVYADALLEHAEGFAERLVQIALHGEEAAALRAIEGLNSRVLGRPKETVETVKLERPAELAAIADMTRAEKDALWRRLMAEQAAASDSVVAPLDELEN